MSRLRKARPPVSIPRPGAAALPLFSLVLRPLGRSGLPPALPVHTGATEGTGELRCAASLPANGVGEGDGGPVCGLQDLEFVRDASTGMLCLRASDPLDSFGSVSHAFYGVGDDGSFGQVATASYVYEPSLDGSGTDVEEWLVNGSSADEGAYDELTGSYELDHVVLLACDGDTEEQARTAHAARYQDGAPDESIVASVADACAAAGETLDELAPAAGDEPAVPEGDGSAR